MTLTRWFVLFILIASLPSIVPALIPRARAQESLAAPQPSVEERLDRLEQALRALEQRLDKVEISTRGREEDDTVAGPVSPSSGMEQRLLAIDRRLESLEKPPAAPSQENATPPAPTATVAASEDGFWIQSADGRFRFRPRYQLHLDGRLYAPGSGGSPPSTFLLRRSQLIAEGSLTKYFEYKAEMSSWRSACVFGKRSACKNIE